MMDALNSISALRGAGATASTGATAAASGVRATGATGFADMLADISGQAVGSLQGAEAAAITGLQGKASVQHVVQTIMAAETTLQTALAVRDKVVAAYQEISRMAI
ncbi:flagellar hook-basal body complex protein FliE [Ancylobacter sp. IITR112]|uniref:flagellar hook-basal body complex protein FliE n=1 Tax=Ancylobacter sp. IITR112 TaxID=3138073 RepID=UPI00352ABD9E